MPAAALPPNELARLDALASYSVLDTACEAAFDDITRLAARLCGTPIALISLIDRDRQWFKSRVGLEAQETPRSMAFCGHAILDPDQPLVVPDATRDPRFADNPLVTGDPGIRFYAGMPLVNTEGHALGTLCVIDKAPRILPPEQVETLVSLARTVSTTLELRRAMRQVEHLALTDALTGLQNRPAFLTSLRKTIARQRRARTPFSLLYLDLDGLKRVNDVQGHAAGDAALIEAGRALRTNIRAEDMAARLGGDEFAALLQGGDGAEAALVAERLRRAIKKIMDDRSFPVTASIGAVCFLTPPEDESEALAMADELMYAAKRGGRNRVLCLDHIDAALAAEDRAGFTSAA